MLSEKIDVLQLTFYTAPVSCLMLFPFYLYREVCCLLHTYPQGENNTQPTASKWTLCLFPVTPIKCFRITQVLSHTSSTTVCALLADEYPDGSPLCAAC